MRLTEEGPPSPFGHGDFDAVCVERAQQGDRTAFDELYDRHHFRLSRHCARLVGDVQEGEDVAQEAFINAWRSIATLQGDRLFYPWIRRIAENLCHEVWRRRARIEPHADVEPLFRPTVASSEERALAHLEMQNLQHALGRLNSRHRGVLVQRGSDLSYERIARNEGIELSAAKTLIWRARAALRRELDATPSKGLVLLLFPIIRFRSLLRALFSRASDALLPISNGAHAASNTFLASSSAIVTAGIVAIAPIAVEASHSLQSQSPAPSALAPSLAGKTPGATGSGGPSRVAGAVASEADGRASVSTPARIVLGKAAIATEPRRHHHKRHVGGPPGSTPSPGGVTRSPNASGSASTAPSNTSSGSAAGSGSTAAIGGLAVNGDQGNSGDKGNSGPGGAAASTPDAGAAGSGGAGNGVSDQGPDSSWAATGAGQASGGHGSNASADAGTSRRSAATSDSALATPDDTSTTTTTTPPNSDSSSSALVDDGTTTTTTPPGNDSSSPGALADDSTTTTTTPPSGDSSSSDPTNQTTTTTTTIPPWSSAPSAASWRWSAVAHRETVKHVVVSQSADSGQPSQSPSTPALTGNTPGAATGGADDLSSNSGVPPLSSWSASPESSGHGEGGYNRHQ